nr:uncharacterized protein LOC109179592 [Ipomoea batatas]
MNVTGKTKDTYKSREELNDYCRRPELKSDLVTGKFPKACYTLDKPARETLCEWVRNLKFPYGYASNMSRCVDMKKLKLFGMKSHDCHVFMQRLITIAFCELLPLNVWKVLTELSLFFKNLTSTTIRVEEMMKLENDIPLILCQLERIFPPSFFDSIEHLPIHLAYEARIAGPVQYRWMYPFERYLRTLKNNVKNKAKVEGSISNAYLVEEASSFYSYYFEDHVSTKHINVPRNADGSEYVIDEHEETLSIFKYSGRAFSKAKARYMTDEEYKAAQSYAHDPSNNISNKFIKDLAKGPLRSVNTYSGYYVNGFKFHTIGYGGAKETMNSGVCIKGINYSVDESDYYGRLVEVVQVEYPGLPIKRTVLFKCDWFDPTSVGMKVHSKYKLVEVNHKRRFNRYEPFVLAMQAAQVYYCTYPSLRRDKLDWWAVCKIKARSNVEILESSISTEDSLISAPFQEETTDNHDLVQIDEDPLHLDDPNSGSPASIGSPADLPISSPSNSNAPPTSSSVAGSSTGCDLTIIHVENVRLIPSHTCSSSMTKIFMKMIHPNGYAWKNVPNEYKDLYFEEFKKFYKWDESIEAQVRKVFLAQAGLRYADMLSKFKTKRTSTRRLDCVAEETWAIWEAYWDRPDVKAKSEQQRKNKMSEVEGPGTGCSKHTGGSRSAIEHYHKLRDELQKEPNLFVCFEQMHKKKDGMFVDERSKRIAGEIQARHDAATQEAEGSTESPNLDMSQLYVDVVGGLRRNGIISTSMAQPQNTQAEHSVNSNDENLGED